MSVVKSSSFKAASLVAAMLAVLALPQAFASFEERSLLVSFALNPDGSAHVQETLSIYISGQQSIDLYEGSVVFNDLSSWRTRTGIEDLQNHVTRAVTSLETFRIRPQPVENCNMVAKTCFASIVWEYDVYPISPNQSGLLKTDSYKPRTTLYRLNTEALNFPVSKTGDIILAKGTTLHIEIPAGAERISFSKIPASLPDGEASFRFDSKTNKRYYIGTVRAFEWSGETLPQFDLSYEIEGSLDDEMLNFFKSFQSSIFASLRSEQGLAVIFVLVVALASAVALHSASRSS